MAAAAASSPPRPARPSQTSGVELSVSPVEIPDTSIQVELYLFDVGGQSIFHQREYFANAVRRRCRRITAPRRQRRGPLG